MSTCLALVLPKKAGGPNFLYYIFVLLLEKKGKIFSTTCVIFLFSAHTSEKYIFEKMEKTLSQGNAHQWFSIR